MKIKLTHLVELLEYADKEKVTDIEILYHRHYHEFDTYFQFDESEQGLLRHREDEFIDEKGKTSQVRYRLTHIGEARERDFPSGALLSRSRFIASATHSLRFYREYFKPCHETFIEKDRLRWRVIRRCGICSSGWTGIMLWYHGYGRQFLSISWLR